MPQALNNVRFRKCVMNWIKKKSEHALWEKSKPKWVQDEQISVLTFIVFWRLNLTYSVVYLWRKGLCSFRFMLRRIAEAVISSVWKLPHCFGRSRNSVEVCQSLSDWLNVDPCSFCTPLFLQMSRFFSDWFVLRCISIAQSQFLKMLFSYCWQITQWVKIGRSCNCPMVRVVVCFW